MFLLIHTLISRHDNAFSVRFCLCKHQLWIITTSLKVKVRLVLALLPPFLDFEGDVCEVTFWAPSDVDTQGFTSVLHVLVPLVLVEQKNNRA